MQARGAACIAKMLIHNHTLKELELSYNEIFNFIWWCTSIITRFSTKSWFTYRLVLWFNGLEDKAARCLANALTGRWKNFVEYMAEAIAESQPDLFLVINRTGKCMIIY